MTKTIENGVTVLTADAGMKLTNGETFGSVVRLAGGDSADNWEEITEEEAGRRQEEMESEEPMDETAAKAAAYDILTGGAE